MKTKLLLVLLLAISCGLVYSYRARLREGIESYLRVSREDPVPTHVIEAVDYVVQVQARGQLTGLETSPVRTPRVRGALKIGWLKEEGTLVRAGDVLVRFDNTDALLTLRENQNTVLTYDSRIKQNELERETELAVLNRDREAADLELDFATNSVRKDEQIFTQWEIQESVMSAALAEYKKLSVTEKAEVRKTLSEADRRILVIEQGNARREVQEAEEKLSALELTAPRSGVLIYKRRGFMPLEVGFEVWPGQDVLEIAGLDSFRSELWVVEADVAGIKPGKSVELRLDAFPSRTFKGTVEDVSRVAEQRSRRDPRRYFTCTVSLGTPPEVIAELKPGMRLTGVIQVQQRESAFVLPKSAVFKEENRFHVFLQEKEEFREQEVEIVDSDHGFFVVQGVEEGQTVALRHPFQSQSLQLPDFSGPATANQNRRFIMVF